ncbi:ATP-binding cassette sub-family C protein [Babesia gibsoni]|uniref:ATP-binding cassette sub-family C protein n=1 Tax=Babesia gibsoni TaxID=33632 RepID=A0AAD8URT9_BABGI|nr:ATP-binding cassette sub-family C protein [Babesia gibsoni]
MEADRVCDVTILPSGRSLLPKVEEGVDLTMGSDDFEPDYRHFNEKGIFNFLFLRWMPYWVNKLNTSYVDPASLPPLPDADDISYWQPIFSKHISDGLLAVEEYEINQKNNTSFWARRKRPRHILFKAFAYTFWRRILVICTITSVMMMYNLGVTILLKLLLDMMAKGENIAYQLSMVFVIVCVEIMQSMIEQHMHFYKMRTEIVLEAVVSITLFEHGLCHRKDYSNFSDRYNMLSRCENLIHSFEPGPGTCPSNALTCPAKRHRNKELSSSMYTYMYFDTENIVNIMGAIVNICKFLFALSLGMFIMYTQIGVGVSRALTLILVFTTVLILGEYMAAKVLKHLMRCRDARLSNIASIIGNLKLLKFSAIEDIGFNIIHNSRADEVSILKTRNFFFLSIKACIHILQVFVVLAVLLEFIENLKASEDSGSFDFTTPVTILFLMNKVMRITSIIPCTMRTVFQCYTSYKRLSSFFNECSANYYLCSEEREIILESSRLRHPKTPDCKMSVDTLVMYKEASFAWIESRDDLISSENASPPILKDIDFELNKGDICIITGSQGSGKTSFIKSILGEMSLVSGSMAVAPLSTGMPIFYTSQEVWLPTDSIRAIITFGYAFDPEIYNEVVRCAELLRDFSSWDDGDMRVISEKGYSLSGGQRVRVSLARALYAYMVFSKANESLENNRCCFLMCLDEPFNGLDVNVATAVFNNLFDKDKGLLIRDDVAIVMAMSKMCVEFILNLKLLDSAEMIGLYNLEGGRICGYTVPTSRTVEDRFQRVLSKCATFGLCRTNSLARMPKYVLETCVSGSFFKSRSSFFGSRSFATTKTDVVIDETQKNKMCSTYRYYWLYFTVMGLVMSFSIAALLVSSMVMENLNSYYIAQWSDRVKEFVKESENATSMDAIIQEHKDIGTKITVCSSLYVAFLVSGFFLFGIANIRSCKKLHTFALNSIFHKCSTVITLKKSIGSIITLFSSDFLQIDEKLMKQFIHTALHVIHMCVQGATVCYIIPTASPVVVALYVLLYVWKVREYVQSSKKVQYVTLDALSDINGLYSYAIAGSSIYRSFRKEGDFSGTIRTHSDFLYRSKFMKLSLNIWVIVISKMVACSAIFLVCLIPLFCQRVFHMNLDIARVGLGISLMLGFNDILAIMIYDVSLTEKFMCSIARYDHYLLKNKFKVTETFDSMGETFPIGFSTAEEQLKAEKKRLADVHKRRKVEYSKFMFRRYRSIFGTLLYRPKIKVMDLLSYLPPQHEALVLQSVCVPQTGKKGVDSGQYILKDVTASTRVGDIIGIVGRTGAGKSTLLGVLQNITRNREGSVLLDGRELSTIPRSLVRHVVGVLPQIPFVFQGWTLRRFLDPRMFYTDDEIFQALDCCGMLEIVRNMPGGMGLDAILVPEEVRSRGGLYLFTPFLKLKRGYPKEVGIRRRYSGEEPASASTMLFSMGQLRLLSFARLVLYKEFYRVLLIDEPPSDNAKGKDDNEDCENAPPADPSMPIYDLVKIYFKHCTTFIVAHDKTAMKSCNMVWIMNKGMLIEQCSMEDFMKNGLKCAEYYQ